jgi:hypothetical protein
MQYASIDEHRRRKTTEAQRVVHEYDFVNIILKTS